MSDAEAPGFVSRWARRKALARRNGPGAERATIESASEEAVVAPIAPIPQHAPPEPAAAAPDRQSTVAADPPPTMEDVARLTPESDYGRFVARGVDPSVRHAAMKKLFSDPHFNVMDGLDVYIDDYNSPDPLPPGMLRRMAQSHLLGLFDDEKPVATDAATPPDTTAAMAPEATAPPDEDPDLRLQPDDAAGPGGHGHDRPGPGEDPAGQP